MEDLIGYLDEIQSQLTFAAENGQHARRLERRSDELATNILESLSDQQHSVLTAAMSQVEQPLRASMITFGIEPPSTSDARWCFDQYFAELNSRFDGGFDPELSGSAHPEELTPPSGLLILGRLQGRPVGCGH